MGDEMSDFDVGDVVRLGCVMKFSLLYDIVNVFHAQIEAGPGWTFAAAAASFQAYVDAMYVSIQGQLSNQVTDDHISVKNVTQATIWGSIAFATFSGGTNVNDPTALQTCLLGWGRTPISRVQVRKYFGPFTEDVMSGGLWTASPRTSVQALMDYYITSHVIVGTMTIRGCAYNYPLARVTFAQTASTTAIPVVQRRRRVGRGS